VKHVLVDKDTRKWALEKLRSYFFFCLALGTFIVLLLAGGVAQQSGVFDYSSGNEGEAPDSAFTLSVKDGARAGYGAAENVLPVLVREITAPLLGKPAYAHATKVCTHSRRGAKSLQTGGGYHLTKFRGHWNRRHHTVTHHMTLTSSGYQSTGKFFHSEPKRVCG